MFNLPLILRKLETIVHKDSQCLIFNSEREITHRSDTNHNSLPLPRNLPKSELGTTLLTNATSSKPSNPTLKHFITWHFTRSHFQSNPPTYPLQLLRDPATITCRNEALIAPPQSNRSTFKTSSLYRTNESQKPDNFGRPDGLLADRKAASGVEKRGSRRYAISKNKACTTTLISLRTLQLSPNRSRRSKIRSLTESNSISGRARVGSR